MRAIKTLIIYFAPKRDKIAQLSMLTKALAVTSFGGRNFIKVIDDIDDLATLNSYYKIKQLIFRNVYHDYTTVETTSSWYEEIEWHLQLELSYREHGYL